MLACDPHATASKREEKHAEERAKLTAWAESMHLQLVLPGATMVPRNGHELMLSAPISRIDEDRRTCAARRHDRPPAEVR